MWPWKFTVKTVEGTQARKQAAGERLGVFIALQTHEDMPMLVLLTDSRAAFESVLGQITSSRETATSGGLSMLSKAR